MSERERVRAGRQIAPSVKQRTPENNENSRFETKSGELGFKSTRPVLASKCYVLSF